MTIILFLLVFISNAFSIDNNVGSEIIIDSDMTFEEAVAGIEAPQTIIDNLELIDVEYYGFDGLLHKGQLVMHKDVADDIRKLFSKIKENKFPVNKCVPIAKYAWSDNLSMQDNNSSGFNYRFIAGTDRLSRHSYGKAIDINPFQNPVIYNDGKISPKGAIYEPEKPGTLTKDNFIVEELINLGWRWGGDWTSLKDYHHFDILD